MSDYQTFYLLRFMSEHAILAWCLAWPVLFIALAIISGVVGLLKALLFSLPINVYTRTLRLVMVLSRGWPKAALMDADGDIIHPKAVPGSTVKTVVERVGNVDVTTTTTQYAAEQEGK